MSAHIRIVVFVFIQNSTGSKIACAHLLLRLDKLLDALHELAERVRVVRDLPRQATDRTCTRVLHVTCRCKPHAERPLAWVVWLGTQRFVPHGATKSKRDVPTYVGVCVCGCGGGSCPSPLPGSRHRSNGRCESSRHSRDLVAYPSGLTKGRLEER